MRSISETYSRSGFNKIYGNPTKNLCMGIFAKKLSFATQVHKIRTCDKMKTNSNWDWRNIQKCKQRMTFN